MPPVLSATIQRTVGCTAVIAVASFSLYVPVTHGGQSPLMDCPRSTNVSWEPDAPTAGTLFRVFTSDTTALSAVLSGEPLHFRETSAATGAGAGTRQTYEALAAVPIDSSAGVTLEYRCGEGPATLRRVTTGGGDYPLERLRVAPKFSAAPDSALAARMRSESARAAAVSRGAHETPILWSTPFVAPRPSRITSGFGGGRTFNGTVTSRHMGTDYAGAVGSPVRAVNRGVVRLVDRFYLGGNVIYVDHGGGLVTAYLHLSKQLVAVGDTVARGAVIGHVGATGRVTGPHLHIIARYGSITVNAAGLPALR